MNVKKIDEIWIKHLMDFKEPNFNVLFWDIFHEDVQIAKLYYKKNEQGDLIPAAAYDIDNVEEVASQIDVEKYIENLYKNEKFIVKLFENDYSEVERVLIGDDFMLCLYNSKGQAAYRRVYCYDLSVIDRFLKYLVPANLPETKFEYITINNKGQFNTITLDLERNLDVDITENYNDDLPLSNYINFCNAEESGISLLYGIPGTGKSTFIKYLMTHTDSDFYVMDANMLANCNSAEFIHFIMNNCKDSVFILEDCEKLLISRDLTYNPILGTLLNLSDGLLGDSLHLKFICTFNTDLNNIDKAVLRKGRLKVKYEFKELTYVKAKAIGDKLGIEVTKAMTLADLYNSDPVDFGKTVKKIGF